MFPGDHGIPHFHGYYGEYVFKVSIASARHFEGEAPGKIVKLTQKWAALHRDELMENWTRCKAMAVPLLQIAPLD
jgi:phosphomannomutase